MRPTIDPGDVILAAPVTTPARVGDMVVFRDPLHADRDIVHRLVGYDAEGGLVTKGDANDTADPWVLQTSDIKGAVALRVPKVGFIVQAIDSRAGILVFLVLPALAILISEGRVWYRFIRYGREAFEPLRHGRHLLVEPAF